MLVFGSRELRGLQARDRRIVKWIVRTTSYLKSTRGLRLRPRCRRVVPVSYQYPRHSQVHSHGAAATHPRGISAPRKYQAAARARRARRASRALRRKSILSLFPQPERYTRHTSTRAQTRARAVAKGSPSTAAPYWAALETGLCPARRWRRCSGSETNGWHSQKRSSRTTARRTRRRSIYGSSRRAGAGTGRPSEPDVLRDAPNEVDRAERSPRRPRTRRTGGERRTFSTRLKKSCSRRRTGGPSSRPSSRQGTSWSTARSMLWIARGV